MPAPVGSGNQAQQALGEYIQGTVRKQFYPLAIDCYEELASRKPNAQGKLVISVVIGGHSSVGGVVEEVSALPESTLDDPAFVTCMTESMMATQFDAPPGDRDSVDFVYPFEFAP